MTCDEKLNTLARLLAARMSGDFSQMDQLALPDAQFAFNGTDTLVTEFPKRAGSTVADAAMALFEKLALHEYAILDAISDGDRLAVQWRGTFSLPGGEPFEAQLFSRWTFAEDGRISSGLDFFDTALLLAKMEEAGPAPQITISSTEHPQ